MKDVEKDEKKNIIINTLTKAYNWAKGRGWNETVIKVILGALFGVACALFLSSCTVGYESTSQKLNVNVLPVAEWKK